MNNRLNNRQPSLALSIVPIAFLLLSLIAIIIMRGADAVSSMSQIILLCATALSAGIATIVCHRPVRTLATGLAKSAKQILPAVIILFFIATVSATWMLSGVVPTLIDYGLEMLNPRLFLFITCAVCSVISVLTGSSWTTIATIGIAFMGIGTVFGYSDGWIAGAIISGAYFGDKVSPLSDTTVLASSSCGVELFSHVKFLMITSIPSMAIALIVFAFAGWSTPVTESAHSSEMVKFLNQSFNITPWILIIPAITLGLILLRVNTMATLAISSLLGLAGLFIFQPRLAGSILGNGLDSVTGYISTAADVLLTETRISTGNELLDSLVSTGGIEGMMPTIYLVLCAMLFGGAMLGSGMLSTITHAFTRRLRSPRSIISTTVGSGLFLNACTADQYLSIIIGGNLYKNLYRRNGLDARLLSRSLEDSISVTSVLIPWNSCGVTQATVLGVATLSYLPYCIFNIMSPLMSLLVAWTGFRINRPKD